jgi:transcriptional regulator with XRE-family HTH domain
MKSREKDDEIFLQLLGNRIASFRKEKHITQIELGYRCDIERGNMRRIEAGNTNPTALTLKKIAAGLGITLAELVDVTAP